MIYFYNVYMTKQKASVAEPEMRAAAVFWCSQSWSRNSPTFIRDAYRLEKISDEVILIPV
jgi:hypothetical protein